MAVLGGGYDAAVVGWYVGPERRIARMREEDIVNLSLCEEISIQLPWDGVGVHSKHHRSTHLLVHGKVSTSTVKLRIQTAGARQYQKVQKL